MKLIGIVLVVLGALALIYGGFTYIQDVHEAEIGPLELQVKEEETVEIPVWLGAGSIALGLVLALYKPRMS